MPTIGFLASIFSRVLANVISAYNPVPSSVVVSLTILRLRSTLLKIAHPKQSREQEVVVLLLFDSTLFDGLF